MDAQRCQRDRANGSGALAAVLNVIAEFLIGLHDIVVVRTVPARIEIHCARGREARDIPKHYIRIGRLKDRAR